MIYFELRIKNPNNFSKGYVISYKDEKSIWIGKGDGEQGEFSSAKFYEAIDKFYKENF